MVKTTAMEKGRAAGREMWNQVLLGNGSEGAAVVACPSHPLMTSFAPTPHPLLCSVGLARSSPFLTVPFLLPCP